ncbi:MAG: glycosyltransferase [Sedimentisphaerales bacterium]|nr:glycosyltransferase [Sedimentisphaerales bacterium]
MPGGKNTVFILPLYALLAIILTMHNGKIIVARFWTKFGGDIPSRTPVILGIDPEKYETITIYLTKNSPNPNIFEQKGQKVFYITENSELPFFKLPVLLKLASILKKEHVDILHSHKHKAAIYGITAGKLARVPIILAHVHGMGRSRNRRRKILNRLILTKADRILAVGQAVKDDIRKNNPSIKPENVINLGNSIDYDYFASDSSDSAGARKKFGLSKKSFVFAAAGRLSPTKGQQYLIEAFAQVKKQLHDTELIIAGTGELKNELENLSSHLGCRSSVHFLNHVDDMRQFYSAADCFVLSSVAEGLPRSLAEAIASGTLCIGTKAGGIPEILNNGTAGLVVPSKDTDSLAKAMNKAANMSPYEKNALLSAAKKYIKENFIHDTIIKRLEDLYGSLVAEKIDKCRKS